MSFPSGGGRHVLVVEDEVFLRRLMVGLLESEGFSVEAVGTGAEGLRSAGKRRFDLALLDVGLPDMSGLDVLAGLHRLPARPRVVVITADHTPETLLRAIREQAHLYLQKPFAPAELLDAVKAALGAPTQSPIEVLSARPEWVELLVPCTREAAERIQLFMRQIDVPLSNEVRQSVGDAFRELLMNAVEWGGRLDPSRRVHISCLRSPRMLLYRIADPGPGFRFDSIPHAATSNPPEDPLQHLKVREERGLRPGGLGLLMVRAIADELLYNEAQNEVVLIKYLGPERTPPLEAAGRVEGPPSGRPRRRKPPAPGSGRPASRRRAPRRPAAATSRNPRRRAAAKRRRR